MEFDPSVYTQKLESENAELRHVLSKLLAGLSMLNVRLNESGVNLASAVEELKDHIFQIIEDNKY